MICCPFCSSSAKRQVTLRSIVGGVRRNYLCLGCSKRYATFELQPLEQNRRGPSFDSICKARAALSIQFKWGENKNETTN